MPQIRQHPVFLLTGATGMVGSYVMAEMLRRDLAVAVMARSKGSVPATDRVDRVLSRFESAWDTKLPRPRVIDAAFDRPGLGLSAETRNWIGQHCSEVIHSAANLSFSPASEHPDNEPYRTNVDGTKWLRDFCAELKLDHWHHISTAYVCGKRTGRVFERDNNVGQDFANDYERSKSIAEETVKEVFSGDSLTIYRPSIVVDPSGIAPVSGDRTIYGAYSMYQMLSARFGLPDDGVWFRNLGFAGHEQKNLVDVAWIARAIATVVDSADLHGRTYHLTSPQGTPINTLDRAFRTATQKWLDRRTTANRPIQRQASTSQPPQEELSAMAAPYVDTFLPYFRDDPVFDRLHIDDVVSRTDLDQAPEIGEAELIAMIDNWSSPTQSSLGRGSSATASPAKRDRKRAQVETSVVQSETQASGGTDDVVISGFAVRLPGGVDDIAAFERLLFEGRSAISQMPADRLDRDLYFDSRRGVPGKTYTEVGGWVDPAPLDRHLEQRIDSLGQFDLTHRQFAQVSVSALASALGVDHAGELAGVDPQRGGIFVGHSGGTQSGGPLAMATMASTATSLMAEPANDAGIASSVAKEWIDGVTSRVRGSRPSRTDGAEPNLNAYSAASLVGRLTGIQGRREVIDAACSSSLVALQHASRAIKSGRLDFALVGGATFNNVDNLALFSRSGACSDSDSHPFDQRASGLISSEGYVAIVVARRSFAEQHAMPIHAVVSGVGVASDGKGKGLWAPRTEGQQLAMKRAVNDECLDVDYLECHATSTQVGDATELESLTSLLGRASDLPLPIGSVKSNLGHLLEAAGLVGVVKCLLAMRRDQLPASINFAHPSDQYDWKDAPVRVVDRAEPWRRRGSNRNRESGQRTESSAAKSVGVNAFGIGGLNAHAVIRQPDSSLPSGANRTRSDSSTPQAMAIVGRGVVLPGAGSVDDFARLLESSRSHVTVPPPGRWLTNPYQPERWVGIDEQSASYAAPHCIGGYVKSFHFDAQAYRIPPKLVQHANPAQLMLIESARQAIAEFDDHQWTVPRHRVGVAVGTIFGGQFSNELQIGLRLPELVEHFRHVARRLGLRDQQTGPLIERYEQLVLDRFSALLDETGGFTASTLASAIARVFDLMGGAFAVDADQASSGLALITAGEQLAAGDVDLVICAAAHRANDLVAMEQLYRKGQLVESGLIEDLPNDDSRVFPGEGVATIVLQRLDDAIAQNRQIYGVIDQITEDWTDDVGASRRRSASRCYDSGLVPSRELVQKIGHLGGAHGLVRVIASTLGRPGMVSPGVLDEIAEDGYRIEYQIGPAPNQNTHQQNAVIHRTEMSSHSASAVPKHSADLPQTGKSDRSDVVSVRLQTSSASRMAEALQSIVENDREDWQGTVKQFSSLPRGHVQAAIVANSIDEVRSTARDLLDGPLADSATMALPRKHGWLRMSESGDRTAWLFPGQGSQYAGVPQTIANCPHAGASLSRFDQRLVELGLGPVSDRLNDPQAQLGSNVWWTQQWVLAVGTALTDSLMGRGHRPDYVLGHSFGECTAAWCAGVMSTDQAIQFAKQRSDAVVATTKPGGQMLSIRAEPAAVHAALRQSGIEYHLTHHNAPQQTVIAGPADQIALAREQLLDAQIAAMVISVPAAFHTPSMLPAQEMLAARFAHQQARPPRFGFLSAISNRYLAEPAEIVGNLIEQLTRPVCFSGAVERLVSDRCGLMIEVGPNDVLTRLARSATGKQAICLAADIPSQPYPLQQTLLDLALEAFGSRGSHQAVDADSDTTEPAPVQAKTSIHANVPADAKFQVFDVTRRSRQSAPSDDVAGRIENQPDRQASRPVEPARKAVEVSSRQPESEPANSPRPAPASDRFKVDPAPVSSVSATVAPGSDLTLAKAFLFDLVVDLTGYDPEIIDFEADLEGELGVDSIKKAQLIGELAQWAGLDIDRNSVRLGEFHSLSDIMSLVGASTQTVPTSGSSMDPPSLQSSDQTGQAVGSETASLTESAHSVADSLQRMIIDLVVDQTGYDEEIIDMEADLEGELGIDSIKRAQLLGELETHYELQSIREQNLRLADFPTLASIHAYVLDFLVDTEKKKSPPLAESSTQVRSDVGSVEVPAKGTHRFVMRTVDAPRRERVPAEPSFHGSAIVVGQNPVADAVIRRFRQSGRAIAQIDSSVGLAEIDATMDRIWQSGLTEHLFIATPYDSAASWKPNQVDLWESRKESALLIPYRVCQRWMQRMIDEDRMRYSSLVSMVRGGGELGFSVGGVNENLRSRSAESGGMAGLTKAMLIEAWMRGFRDTPMLVLDSDNEIRSDADADHFVDGVWRELAVPSYDEEVVVAGQSRKTVQAVHVPLPRSLYRTLSPADAEPSADSITPGGNWLVAGGGRGITAMTAMALAERHGLKLHLLGMAKAEAIDSATRQAAIDDRNQLRRETMKRVQQAGGNPVKYWRDYEKAVEIDQTLEECKRRGIDATYHSVNVADAVAVAGLVDKIRDQDGPIRGVIQGAGSGQDARFDRKRADKVQQCLDAKIDGCASLAAATAADPLEWFVGFGSISGRFGANGHTDYSAANDMLAKMIGRLGEQRPDTKCVTFHWHAWGDIGMATKPEARLALDMIGMEFMPAEEGLQHFLNELEHGGQHSEVLITDRRYIRKFFPCPPAGANQPQSTLAPMLDPNGKGWDGRTANSRGFQITLDPKRDLFLSEHLVGGRPTLPIVMAIEMLAQASRTQRLIDGSGGTNLSSFKNVRAIRPLKCLTDDAFAIELMELPSDDPSSSRWCLVSDLRRRDGRMVEAAREHFDAEFTFGAFRPAVVRPEELLLDRPIATSPVEYLPPDAPVYHGPPLRCLRDLGFAEIETADSFQQVAAGTIVAPSPAHLAGENRPLEGWVTSPATMDAVLYAAGSLAYHVVNRASLPVRFDRIELGRLPDPGEPMRVVVRWEGDRSNQQNGQPRGANMSAVLAGQNHDLIVRIDGYEIGWLM